ncbi:MAG TPA: hypothetical protein VJL88_07620 [Nitrospira sp.]|nr:hypothetical protein [Nitrospira sp.]
MSMCYACNSDVPVVAVAEIGPAGLRLTVTRVATHPFLARFNLKLTLSTPSGCSAASDLFPDTGGVSRRNVYRGSMDRLYVVGQYDVRRVDITSCRIDLLEFRALEGGLLFVGSFDTDGSGRWQFLPAEVRPERPFQPL